MVIYFFFFFSSRRRHTRFSRDWSSDVCSSDLLSCCVVGISALAMPSPARAPTFRNTAPGVSYTGSKECAPCHRQIYETYIQSPMGRSMSLATDASHLEKIREPFTTLSPLLNRAYTVFRSGSAFYQSEQEW